MDVLHEILIKKAATLIGPLPVIVRCKYCCVVDAIDAVSWTFLTWTKTIQAVKPFKASASTINSGFIGKRTYKKIVTFSVKIYSC